MRFLHCMLYLALTGAVGFVAGRLLPRGWPDPYRGWWRSFPFERQGRIYEKLKIRRWQKKVPDISRILPQLMPAKRLEGRDLQRLPEMIRETCVAELTHWLLCLAGLYCLRLWRGVGGTVMALLNVLGNLPFILIQRYNRPRLKRLLHRSTGLSLREGMLCVH